MGVATDFKLMAIEGDSNILEAERGKALLIVNVASECGFTPQYKQLQSLHDTLAGQGFAVVGVPCNQFGGQEPGSEKEIMEFCSTRFSVSFPMSRKVNVNGPDRHPLFAWLTDQEQGFPGDVAWNFEKFLLDSEGALVGRYPSATDPRDNGLMQDIAQALPG